MQSRFNTAFSTGKTASSVFNQAFFPSLNGLRAVSIVFVVLDHLTLVYHLPFTFLISLGPLGVDIFFVISGFLITTLCIKELLSTGNLSLQRFYVRRFLRVIPVAYLYILVIFIIDRCLGLHLSGITYLSAVLLLVNFSYFGQMHGSWLLGHYWSLSLEEQFYLLFPVMIKLNIKLFLALLLFVVAVTPAILFLQVQFGILNNNVLAGLIRYSTKFQGMAVGCLCSILLFKGWLNFGRWKPVLGLVSVTLMFCFKYTTVFGLQNSLFNLTTSVSIAIVLTIVIEPSDTIFFKFLNLKGMNFIGQISYSVYIWQQLFIYNNSQFLPSRLGVNLLFLIAVPLLSYFYYEKPLLNLKRYFEPAGKGQNAFPSKA